MQKIEDKLEEEFTGKKIIEGMGGPQKNEKLEVINHYMAGSYNSCFIDKFNFASLDALKLVLSKGIRCLDFEVFMVKNNKNDGGSPNFAVVGSERSRFQKKKAIANCQNKKEPIMNNSNKEHVKMKDVFDTIAYEAFIGKHQRLPIFINLRI